MQKVICPYCGRVAKYVDSSVIYYGHSYGMAFGSVDDAKAGAGLRDQTTDSRGLTKIVIDYASNVQAMAVYNLAQQLDLVAPGYYRSRYIDAAKTAQYIEIGQISAGDAEHVTTLCKKAAIEYKIAA